MESTVSKLRAVTKKIRRSIAAMTWSELLFISFYVLCVIGGNGGQVLAINFWLPSFNAGGGPFTVLTVVSTTTAFAFVFTFIAQTIYFHFSKNQSFRFLSSWRLIFLCILLGLCNALNGVLLIFATGAQVPEQYQAMLISSQIVWCYIFMRIFIRDESDAELLDQAKNESCGVTALIYVAPAQAPLLLLSFILSIGGIIVGMLPSFQGSSVSGMTPTLQYWTLIFALSMLPGAAYNVVACIIMRDYSTPADISDLVEQDKILYNEMGGRVSLTGPTEIVKMFMLAFGGLCQVIWLFILFPLDATPWFGTNPTPEASRIALYQGWQCIATCPDNGKYFGLFVMCYIAQYFGSANLNKYSSTFTAMVAQLSSPLTTLALIIIPALRATPGPLEVGPTVGSIVMLVLGTLLYFLWEEFRRMSDGEEFRLLNDLTLSGEVKDVYGGIYAKEYGSGN